MALTTQIIDYNFSGGEMQGTDPRLLDSPYIVDSRNMQVEKTGQLSKRLGYLTIEDIGSIDSMAHTLFTAPRDSLNLLDAQHGVYTISTTTLANDRLLLSDQGPKPSEISVERFFTPRNGMIYCDSAVLETNANERFICICWTEDVGTYDTYVSVVEEATGTVVIPRTSVNSGNGRRYARVTVAGDGSNVGMRFFVLVYETTTSLPTSPAYNTNIGYSYADMTGDSPAFVDVALTGVAAAEGRWDICGAELSAGNVPNNRFYIAAIAGTTRTVYRVSVASTTATTLNTIGAADISVAPTQGGIAITQSPLAGADILRVAHISATAQLVLMSLSPSTGTAIATNVATNIGTDHAKFITIVDVGTSNYSMVAYSGEPMDGVEGGPTVSELNYSLRDSGFTVVASGVHKQAALASKAYCAPGQNPGFVMFCTPWDYVSLQENSVIGSLQPTYIMYEYTATSVEMCPRGNFLRDFAFPVQGNHLSPSYYNFNHCYLPSLTTHFNFIEGGQAADSLDRDWTFYGAFPFSDGTSSLESADVPLYYNADIGGIALVRCDLLPKPLQHVRVNNNVYFEGGLFSYFDRYVHAESTPLQYPEITIVDATAVGLNIDADSYYRVVWWCQDQNGIIHRSASEAFQSTAGAANTNRVYFSRRAPNALGDDVSPLLWKAALYRSSDGSTYNLVASGYPPFDVAQGYSYLDDSYPSADVAGLPVLYTEGGVIDAYCPPPLLGLVSYDGRLFAINGDNQSQVLHTKSIEPLVSPEWNPDLYVSTVSGGGIFTALAVLDDKLILFKKDQIYVLTGQGPSQTGLGGYPQLAKLSSDVGCVARSSVASGDFGVVFQTRRGLAILGRDLTISYAGDAVEDTLAEYPHIQRAAVVPERSQVRFLVSDTARVRSDSTTKLLAWDYLHNSWGIWDVAEARDLCDWQESSVLVTTSADIRIQQDYVDSAGGNTGRFKTPWLKPAGPQGAARVFKALVHGRAGEDLPPSAAVNVTVLYDFEDTGSETHSFVLTEGTRFSFDIRPGRQQCNAIRFAFSEATLAGQNAIPNSAWAKFSGITLVVGVNEGTNPLATRST